MGIINKIKELLGFKKKKEYSYWITNSNAHEPKYYCSHCESAPLKFNSTYYTKLYGNELQYVWSKYCPHCGAYMVNWEKDYYDQVHVTTYLTPEHRLLMEMTKERKSNEK